MSIVAETFTQAYIQGLEHALRLVQLYEKYGKDAAKELEQYIEDQKVSEV